MSVSRAAVPGLTFLINSTPSIVLRLLVVRGAFFIIGSYFSVSVPKAIQAICYILSTPTYFMCCVFWSMTRSKLKAASRGSVEVPSVEGSLPGNLDFAREWVKSLKGFSYIGYALEKQFIRFGPIWNSRLFWLDLIHTSQPEHIKIILVNEFQNFVKGKISKEALNDFLGTGVINSDGEMWQFHRAMIRPFFARDKAIQYTIFEKMADKAISILLDRTKEGLSTNMQDLLTRYTFDGTVEFLFSMKFCSLDQDLPNPHYVVQTESTYTNGARDSSLSNSLAFSRAFEVAQSIVASRLQLGAIWPLREIMNNWTTKPMKVIDSILYELIDRHLKTAEELKDIDEDNLNLLDQLSLKVDDKTVWKDEILNLFVAAREATAALATFAVYSLANHPNVLKRLRAEVLGHLGLDRVPTFDDIKDMKYLRSVINETLRMYPPTPINVRESVSETSFPSVDPGGRDFFIPAKTKIMYHTFIMHRRKDLWGPDAQEFDPDRWLDDRLQNYFLANPFIFLPFNAGPRICPGQQYAINEVSFMIIRLLQKFEGIELDIEAQPPEWRVKPEWAEGESFNGFSKEKITIKSNLTLFAPGGVWVKLRPVSSESG